MGLFGDVDLKTVPEDPYYVAPGTYVCRVTKAAIRQPKKQGSNPGLAINFKIDDENAEEFDGQNLSTWNTVYPNATKEDIDNDPTLRKSMSYLRKFLTGMGIPPEEHNTFDENLDDLVGQYFLVTCFDRPDEDNPAVVYTNVSSVTPYEEGE